MRLALSIAILGLASQSIAQQMPIPAFGNTYTGSTRGFSFQAPVSGMIIGLSVPNENLQSFQVVEVTSWGTAGPTAWPTQTAPVAQLFYDNASVAGSTISVAIPLVAGEWYGILGSCTGTVGAAAGSNSYGTPAGPYASSMLGVPCTLTRFLTQNSISATGGNGLCATEGGGALARVEVTVSGTGSGSIAMKSTFGTGCVNEYASMHQTTTLDVFALNNGAGSPGLTGIDYINTGGGYLVTTAAGTFVPVGTVDPLTVPVPGVGDDAVVPAGTLGLEFGSNGWLATGSGNSNGWSPNAALFLGQPAAQFSFWSDFQPNTGGDINFEEAGTRTLLTYTDVLAWGTTDLNTFQFDYDSATGNCSMYLGALASATAHPTMIGYSPAGPNLNPGSIDIAAELAATGAIILGAGDTAALSVDGIGRPVMGAAPTPYQATTSNIEAGALFHAGLLGLTDPNTPLSIIGFPAGCTLYSSAEVLVGPATVAGGPGSLTWTVLGLPIASPAFNGVELYAAAVTLDLSIVSATSRSSNGIKLTLGDL
jgi:hypothetical protein